MLIGQGERATKARIDGERNPFSHAAQENEGGPPRSRRAGWGFGPPAGAAFKRGQKGTALAGRCNQ